MATKNADTTTKTSLNNADLQLVYTVISKLGTADIKWTEIAAILSPEAPEKANTVSKRWNRLMIKFEKDFGTLEIKPAAGTPDIGEPGSAKAKNNGGGKTAGKKRGKNGGDDTEDLVETPSKKVKVKSTVKVTDSEDEI